MPDSRDVRDTVINALCPDRGIVTIGQRFTDPAWDVDCTEHGRIATQQPRLDAFAALRSHILGVPSDEGGEN